MLVMMMKWDDNNENEVMCNRRLGAGSMELGLIENYK